MVVNSNSIFNRYFYVVLILALLGIGVVVKAGIIMFGEREYWNDVASRLVKENIPVDPSRGNILSANGELMASSLPEFRIYMDFMAGDSKKDSLLMDKLDSISQGLHRIIPGRSAAEFRSTILRGRKAKSRYFLLYPGRISYTQYKEVQELPLFRRGRNASGFFGIEYNRRKKPFGSLAARTLGDVYADSALGAKNGIELAFDTLLKGRKGVMHRKKIRNEFENIIDVPATDGYDIVTTIDVDMQDICEKALVDKLKELEAFTGVAVLMEVKTGDVKAIVNMTRGSDGEYHEVRNNAISDMMEPGSTFKTASIMVALEDGKVEPDTEVDTGNGQKMMYGRNMKDHNWNRGGYGVINVSRILEVSSNVGVSSIIDKYYHDDPQKFVDGLRKLGIADALHLQIAGEGTPNIKGPKERYFAKTTLPWMSIGYETQVPPMNILAFYNAIANDGVMVRPRLVTEAVDKDGNVVKEYPVEVMRDKICSDETLAKIRTILRRVVSDGLAKAAGSKQFAVAGKTGTAQVSQGAAGYTAGGRRYLVSFCGYFPAEEPKYSLIVSIQKPGLPASGGLMAGSVFSKIAERVFAKNLSYDLKYAIDSTSNVIPDVKNGDLGEARYVLEKLDIPTNVDTDYGGSETVWGQAHKDSTAVSLVHSDAESKQMPNVRGMGAKDAVYILEQAGLKVRLSGVGKVTSQSISAGSRITKGQTVALHLRK